MDDPTVIPFIAYEDPAAALEWLARAFGFKERHRIEDAQGRISHAEMDVGRGGVIFLAWGGEHYESPKRHAATCAAARRWLAVPYTIDGLHVYVDDVEAHHRRAQQAGAHIASEPVAEPYGTLYRAEDLEGHRWMFNQPC